MGHSLQRLLADLHSGGVPRSATVLVHSGMRGIGPVEGGADTVLDALSEYFAPGLLVLPTHSWEYMERAGDVFDPAVSPSCVGVLSDLFWRRPGVARSWHPTHSVAALGAGAQEFVAGEETRVTPCPREGVYGRLLDRGAYILFISCPMSKNTFVHGVEEWQGVPQRLRAVPLRFQVRLPGGRLADAPQFGHQAPIPDISSNYGKLELPLRELGLARDFGFGDANVVVTSAAAVEGLTARFLARDADLFMTADPVPTDWYLPAPE